MPKKKAKKDKLPPSQKTSSNVATAIPPTQKDLPAGLVLPVAAIPKNQFSVEAIFPGYVWVVHNFFKTEECQAWINHVETSKKLEYVQHPASRYITNRECFRWQRNDDQIADTLFQRMQHCGILKVLESGIEFPSPNYGPMACNPNIRLYKYEKGMSFGKHVDESNALEGIGQTEITVLVYLSDCQGGATRFYPPHGGGGSGKQKKNDNKSIAFVPRQGTMLLHVHGDRCLEHEADPVVQGLKYILRTDVVYRGS